MPDKTRERTASNWDGEGQEKGLPIPIPHLVVLMGNEYFVAT